MTTLRPHEFDSTIPDELAQSAADYANNTLGFPPIDSDAEYVRHMIAERGYEAGGIASRFGIVACAFVAGARFVQEQEAERKRIIKALETEFANGRSTET
jgi:hypothetical protein